MSWLHLCSQDTSKLLNSLLVYLRTLGLHFYTELSAADIIVCAKGKHSYIPPFSLWGEKVVWGDVTSRESSQTSSLQTASARSLEATISDQTREVLQVSANFLSGASRMVSLLVRSTLLWAAEALSGNVTDGWSHSHDVVLNKAKTAFASVVS